MKGLNSPVSYAWQGILENTCSTKRQNS